MAKLTGTVQYRDLEGGLWLLTTSDGRTFQLDGGDGGLRRDGLEVEVEGEVAEDMMSLGMTGPILKVRRYKTR